MELPIDGRSVETSVDVSPTGKPFAVTLGFEGAERLRSGDGGRSYEHIGTMTRGLGTRDADVSVAPEPLAPPHPEHTVFMIDLWEQSVSLEVSFDGGDNWLSNPAVAHLPHTAGLTQAGQPLHERPWVAADGRDTAYVSYVGPQMMVMHCTARPAPLCGPPVPASATPPGERFWPGRLVVDHERDRLYQPYLEDGPAGALSQIWVATSTDGGLTFERSLVHEDPQGLPLNNFFALSAVDAAGNVYVAWSDDRDVKLAVSTDAGATWGDPLVVNETPSDVARAPWIAAGSEGIAVLTWYGSDRPDSDWFPYFAQVRGLVDGGDPADDPQILQEKIREERVFFGELGRALLDFFAVAVDPTDGAAVTVFTEKKGSATSFSTRQCGGPSAIEGPTLEQC